MMKMKFVLCFQISQRLQKCGLVQEVQTHPWNGKTLKRYNG